MTFQKITTVNVGIVGLGLVSDSHIKGYQSHPDAEVIAVCDLDEQRAQQICQRFGSWIERPGALDDGRPVSENHVGWRDIKTTMAALCSAREGVPVKVDTVTDVRFSA